MQGEREIQALKRRWILIFFAIAVPAFTVLVYLAIGEGPNRSGGWFIWGLHLLLIVLVVCECLVIVASVNSFRRSIAGIDRKTYHLGRAAVFGVLLSAFTITFPFFFALLYLRVEGFTGSGGCVSGASGNLDTLYFSYTTITTLGYGDLHPLGLCRAVSSVEALFGLIGFGLLTATLFAILSVRKHS